MRILKKIFGAIDKTIEVGRSVLVIAVHLLGVALMFISVLFALKYRELEPGTFFLLFGYILYRLSKKHWDEL